MRRNSEGFTGFGRPSKIVKFAFCNECGPGRDAIDFHTRARPYVAGKKEKKKTPANQRLSSPIRLAVKQKQSPLRKAFLTILTLLCMSILDTKCFDWLVDCYTWVKPWVLFFYSAGQATCSFLVIG